MLRRDIASAWEGLKAQLGELSERRLEVLKLDAWQYHKPDMVEYAQAHGGIGPDLESLYHTRDSKFFGY